MHRPSLRSLQRQLFFLCFFFSFPSFHPRDLFFSQRQNQRYRNTPAKNPLTFAIFCLTRLAFWSTLFHCLLWKTFFLSSSIFPFSTSSYICTVLFSAIYYFSSCGFLSLKSAKFAVSTVNIYSFFFFLMGGDDNTEKKGEKASSRAYNFFVLFCIQIL